MLQQQLIRRIPPKEWATADTNTYVNGGHKIETEANVSLERDYLIEEEALSFASLTNITNAVSIERSSFKFEGSFVLIHSFFLLFLDYSILISTIICLIIYVINKHNMSYMTLTLYL